MIDNTAEVRARAAGLLRRGELCALAGKEQYARTLLEQAWATASEVAPDVANDAAWDVAWLLAQGGKWGEAATWLERVLAPAWSSLLWPVAQHAMLQLCRAADQRGAPGPYLAAASPTCAIAITSLGQFKIALAGQPLPPCKSQKASAILRYLAARPGWAAGREELMELFWPAARPQDAANSLHAAVSLLRRYLSGASAQLLCFDGGRYLISPTAEIEDDRQRFVGLVDLGGQLWRSGDLAGAHEQYAAAVACYSGDYYVDSRDPAWFVAEREQLLVHYHTALERIAWVAAGQGRYEQAVECYQAVLQRDSYREDLHYQLICCFQQLSRRSDALRQYQRCSSVLSQELGIEPMPELQALYQRILNGEAAPPP
jgi:DNA-binding SARP family transcriptional activator